MFNIPSKPDPSGPKREVMKLPNLKLSDDETSAPENSILLLEDLKIMEVSIFCEQSSI